MKTNDFQEIEQRWAIDPRRWLILPNQFSRFHQAEIATGEAHVVMQDFRKRVSRFWFGLVFTGEYREVIQELGQIYQWIHTAQKVKLRVRAIIDPFTDKQSWQLTLKEKLKSKNGFKRYREYDILISFWLAENLIKWVSPEWGVRKDRYNVAWPDGRLWDIDTMIRNTDFIRELKIPLTLWEIEVNSVCDEVVYPKWAIHQINGNKQFKCFWTAELQKTPWENIDISTRQAYLEILANKIGEHKSQEIATLQSFVSSQNPLPLE